MKTQEQQNERSEQLNDISWKKRNDANVNIIRQSRGRPTLTGQELKTENKTILNTLHAMRSRKRRKRSPGLLHYSGGRWRNETQVSNFRQVRYIPRSAEKRVQTGNS
jgi:hypothetical protein